jgi:hypothetical protein
MLCRTTIHSNEWRSNIIFKYHNFFHQSVNYSKNIINQHTGAQTQTIGVFMGARKS